MNFFYRLWFVVFVGLSTFIFFTQFQFRLFPAGCVSPAALSKQFLSKKCLQLVNRRTFKFNYPYSQAARKPHRYLFRGFFSNAHLPFLLKISHKVFNGLFIRL